MIRILQTGDNHIGIRYTRHDAKDKLKQARLDALRNCVRAANDNRCNIIAVTGDLFDSVKSIPRRDIKTVVEIFSEFNGEAVVVIPGNHDYYDGSAEVWEHFSEYAGSREKIVLANEYRPYSIDIGEERVTFYPAYCDSLHSEENRLGWIKAYDIMEDSTDYRIGMAHGAIEGLSLDAEGRYFSMTERELEDIPLDAWLIGHTHVQYPRGLKEEGYIEGYKVFNAGTHSQTDIANNTEGCCFILELDRADGKCRVRAKRAVTGEVRFYREDIALTAAADNVERFRESINSVLKNYSDRSVVEIILHGRAVKEVYAQREDVYKELLGRFLEGTAVDKDLSIALTEDMIRDEYSETSLPAKLLLELLDDPKETQLAYDLLKTLKL